MAPPTLRFADLVRLLTRPSRAVVLIDGGSGSGKSVFAGRLADAWPRGVQVVSLDALYPGWDGLAAGSAAVPALTRPDAPGYRAWDWAAAAPGRVVPLDPRVDLIVEGCGALTPPNRRLATAGVWLDLDASQRRLRALARDGETFAPHWERWAAQERAHWAANRPADLADVVVAGERITTRHLDWAE